MCDLTYVFTLCLYMSFIGIVFSFNAVHSAVNSCPVSPTSGFRQPNFDFKAMATYASKLLSDNEVYRAHPFKKSKNICLPLILIFFCALVEVR